MQYRILGSMPARKQVTKFWVPVMMLLLALLAIPRAARAQTPTFSPELQHIIQVNYGTFQPFSAAVGDFNGDKQVDALVTDGGPNVHLLLGNGDGTFTEQQIYIPGNPNPGAIQAADLNGDGKLDAVFGSNGGNEAVTVLLNTGNDANGVPQFTVTTYATGLPGIRSVTVGDLNGDGHPDLIVGDCCGTFRVLLNNGDGTFTLGQTYGIMPNNGGPSVGQGVIADLNGDGKADYIVVSAQADATDIFYGNGDGTFQNPVVLPGQAYSVAVADLNGDGRPDIILGMAGNVAVYLNQGGGTFSAPVIYSTSNNPQISNYVFSVAVGDLTGDGSLDVVAANFINYTQALPGKSVAVLPVNSNGTLGAAQLFTDEYDPTSVAIADFNGDGKLDIGTVGYASRTYNVLLNSTPSAIAATTTTLASSANPSVYGQAVTFTAAVGGTGGNTPAGSVTFKDGAATLGSVSLNAAGQASFTTASLAVGAHAITASYGGNAQFSASASGTLTQAVNQAATSLALTSSANPALLNQPITLTAMLSVVAPGAGSPSGTVQFLVDGSPSGAPVSVSGGKASLSLSNLSVGSHTIYADYSGDADFLSSAGDLSQAVNYRFLGLYAPYSTLRKYQPGQAIPLIWQYADYSGRVVNSSGAEPMVSFAACAGGAAASASAEGASGYQYFGLTNAWQFNWNTTGVSAGCYNLTITSNKTGQSNGPFPVLFR